MQIHVTQEDIDSGNQSNGYNCAIARAIRRTYGLREGDIRVGNRTIDINMGKRFELPIEAQEFVMKFDLSKQDVSPFSFTAIESPYLSQMAYEAYAAVDNHQMVYKSMPAPQIFVGNFTV